MRATMILGFALTFLVGCGGSGGDDHAEEVEPQALLSSLARDEIVVDVSPDKVRVYVPFDDDRQYVAYRVIREDALWRLEEAYLTTLEQDSGTFTRAYSGASIVNPGEWSHALREEGAADFIGGYHGSEVTRSVTIEGVPLVQATQGRNVATEFSLETQGEIFRLGTDAPIVNVASTYSFDASGVKVQQKLDWLSSAKITSAYLAMFPIKRKLQSGEQITDMAYRSPDYLPEDVLTEGFPVIQSVGTRTVRLEGSWSTISAEVSVTDYSGLPEPRVFISAQRQYNKVYFDFKSSPAAGDRWEVTAKYRIKKKGLDR